jgi:Glyoxalase-like domain
MTLRLSNVTFDCTDAARVATFWSAVLGRPVDDGRSQYFASIDLRDHSQITWLFITVPESKTAKNRMHVDLHADDRQAEVARVIGLGARHVADHDEHGLQWTVLLDVEGNEFCIS